jgi:hypothetical protein
MQASHLTIRNCVFSFKCDAKWENMQQDNSDDYLDSQNVRFCTTCQKEVFLSLTDEDLVRNVRLNRCIAIERLDGVLMQITSGQVMPDN